MGGAVLAGASSAAVSALGGAMAGFRWAIRCGVCGARHRAAGAFGGGRPEPAGRGRPCRTGFAGIRTAMASAGGIPGSMLPRCPIRTMGRQRRGAKPA